MILIIFMFSEMNSVDSNGKSKMIIKKSIEVVDKVFDLDMDNNDIDKIVVKMNYPFRKVCHFSEYFILSLLLVLSLRLTCFSRKKAIIITIIFCSIFSVSDEFHQMFVSGRSPLIIDCFIDILGCFLFCILYYFKTKKS